MRGASDVPMSEPCFTMKVNSPSFPCKKNTQFRNLCAIQRSPLNICSFASSIVSLFVHEKALLMSVSEFRWDFPREVRCHPVHRCASIAPSLLRPRRKPCQFGEKCSSPPSETVSLTIAAKRLFHQGHRTWMTRVPSIPFFPSRFSIRVPFEQCALHGVWSARCACTRTETNSCFARVYFFAVFVISSTPMPSSRRGPTDRCDGDAQMRKSSAGALHRGAALRLFPFASSFTVERIVFALVTMFMSNGSRGGKSAWNSRSVSPLSTT